MEHNCSAIIMNEEGLKELGFSDFRNSRVPSKTAIKKYAKDLGKSILMIIVNNTIYLGYGHETNRKDYYCTVFLNGKIYFKYVYFNKEISFKLDDIPEHMLTEYDTLGRINVIENEEDIRQVCPELLSTLLSTNRKKSSRK